MRKRNSKGQFVHTAKAKSKPVHHRKAAVKHETKKHETAEHHRSAKCRCVCKSKPKTAKKRAHAKKGVHLFGKKLW